MITYKGFEILGNSGEYGWKAPDEKYGGQICAAVFDHMSEAEASIDSYIAAQNPEPAKPKGFFDGVGFESLEIRKTHKYVGTYRHLDSWETIGRAYCLQQRKLERESNPDDEFDVCEPESVILLYKVEGFDGAKLEPEQVKRALQDLHNQRGCAHEHDCCGCRSYYAGEVLPEGGDLWSIKVSSSRNY